MNIDWKQIEKEFPLAYAKFKKYCGKILPGYLEEDAIYYDHIEAFFDSVGIIIDISAFPSFFRPWSFNILNLKYVKIMKLTDDFLNYHFKTRQEAKEASVYKAFEIYNNFLKGSNNERTKRR